MTDKSKGGQKSTHFLDDSNDELAALLGELEDLDLNAALDGPKGPPTRAEVDTAPPRPAPTPVAVEPAPTDRAPAERAPVERATMDRASMDRASMDRPLDRDAERRIAQLEAEVDALRTKAQRAAQDFANYRKRIQKERDDAVTFANEKVFKDLLTVVDNFQLALKHGTTGDAQGLLGGVQMTYQQMLATLARHDMVPFDAINTPFDPRLHQALSREVRTDAEPGTVVAVAQQGFLLKGRLLRPALVTVATAGDGEAPPARRQNTPSQPEIRVAPPEPPAPATRTAPPAPAPPRRTVSAPPAPEAPRAEAPVRRAPPAPAAPRRSVSAAPAAPVSDDMDPLAELDRALAAAAHAVPVEKGSSTGEAAAPDRTAPAKAADAEEDWGDWDDGIGAMFEKLSKDD